LTQAENLTAITVHVFQITKRRRKGGGIKGRYGRTWTQPKIKNTDGKTRAKRTAQETCGGNLLERQIVWRSRVNIVMFRKQKGL